MSDFEDYDLLFVARYGGNARTWLREVRFRDNIGLTELSGRFSLHNEINIEYNLLCGTAEIIQSVDEAWGGKYKLADKFRRYVGTLPEEDRELATASLLPLMDYY